MLRSEVKHRGPGDRAFWSAFDYDFAVGRLVSIFLLGIVACAPTAPRTVPRIVDGHVEHGAFVPPYAYRWFVEGEVLAVKGQHDEAAMALEAAAATPTDDVVLLTRLAEEYEASGASRRADRTLALARRSNPDSARVALSEGLVQRARGETGAALAAFARAQELAPTWDEPVVATAETLVASGLPQRASSILFEYLETSPAAGSARSQSVLIDLALHTVDLDTLQRALALDPRSTPADRARAAAELALEAEQPALAARALEHALDTPDNVALWLRALVRSGDRAKAATFLTSSDGRRLAGALDPVDFLLDIDAGEVALRLLETSDGSARAELSRGRAQSALGQYLAGAVALAEVPFGAAGFEASRLALAQCAIALTRPGAAAEVLNEVPHESLALRRQRAEISVGEGDLRGALRLFDPKRSVERGVLASLLERAGHFDEAAAYYASVDLRWRDGPALQARAAAEQLASRGQRAGAIAILEQWATFAPEDIYARVRLVELLMAENRVEAGKAKAREALKIIGDPALRAHLLEVVQEPPAASD
ncbi:MAG: hypothetical protein WCE62_21710 [Polyangiales bacterium]